MGVNADIVADGKRSGVDEADASAAPQLRVQGGDQRKEDRGHQLHEARIAHQGGKLAAQMTVDILGVVGFERTIVGLLEQDDNGHHFDFDTSGLGVRAGAVLRSVNPAARLAQTAARNRQQNKRVRVYS